MARWRQFAKQETPKEIFERDVLHFAKSAPFAFLFGVLIATAEPSLQRVFDTPGLVLVCGLAVAGLVVLGGIARGAVAAGLNLVKRKLDRLGAPPTT